VNIGTLLQSGIVGAFVAASLFHLFGRFAPRTRARLQSALAGWLDQPQRSPWLRAAGSRLRPAVKTADGCAAGCSSCNHCGPPSTSASPGSGSPAQPLRFQRLPNRH
jgi:hypothetical protein